MKFQRPTHPKDSLWSCDLFRCESATLRTYWVLVVMDQFTRRVIGFGVHCGAVDGVTLCRMFQRAIRGHGLPKYLSSDHDPLYRFHQWQANPRVLEVNKIKMVPHVPLSHPFVERLIGTIRREYLDRILFWTTADLEAKLFGFQNYFKGHRTHAALEGPGRTDGRRIWITRRPRLVSLARKLGGPHSNRGGNFEFAMHRRARPVKASLTRACVGGPGSHHSRIPFWRPQPADVSWVGCCLERL